MPITVNIDPPLVSDSPEVFNSKAFAAWEALSQLGPQINTEVAAVNSNRTAAQQARDAAVSASQGANGSAQAAQQARDAAQVSATTAGQSAATAQARAQTATTKAQEAADSAAAAAQSAIDAANAAAGEPAIPKAVGYATWTGTAWQFKNEAYVKTGDIGVSVQAYSANLDAWADKSAPSGNVVGTEGAQDLKFKRFDLCKILTAMTHQAIVNNGTVSGVKELTFATGHYQVVQLTGNTTLGLSFPGIGEYTLFIWQDANGNRNVALNYAGNPISRIIGAAAMPAINASPHGLTMCKFFFDGTNAYVEVKKVNAA